MNKLINGAEETNFLCRRIPNNFCRYPTLSEVKQNIPLLNCGLCTVNFFQRVLYGKGEGQEKNHTMEKTAKHYFSQLIKVNINSYISC